MSFTYLLLKSESSNELMYYSVCIISAEIRTNNKQKTLVFRRSVDFAFCLAPYLVVFFFPEDRKYGPH